MITHDLDSHINARDIFLPKMKLDSLKSKLKVEHLKINLVRWNGIQILHKKSKATLSVQVAVVVQYIIFTTEYKP